MSGRSAALRGGIALFASTLVLAACSATAPTARPAGVPLSPPTFDAIGILIVEDIEDPRRTYVLADGRSFEITIPETRLLFDAGGGVGSPFVKGADAIGPFIAIFGHQDGLV